MKILSYMIIALLLVAGASACTDKITCYKCSGTDLKTKIFDGHKGCSEGYAKTEPVCSTITCYKCKGLESESKAFNNRETCPFGFKATEPVCSVTCYKCSKNDELTTKTFAGDKCFEKWGWSEDKPICGDNPPPPCTGDSCSGVPEFSTITLGAAVAVSLLGLVFLRKR